MGHAINTMDNPWGLKTIRAHTHKYNIKEKNVRTFWKREKKEWWRNGHLPFHFKRLIRLFPFTYKEGLAFFGLGFFFWKNRNIEIGISAILAKTMNFSTILVETMGFSQNSPKSRLKSLAAVFVSVRSKMKILGHFSWNETRLITMS